jgi:cytochrome c-type biogenesis protein CcmH
VSERLRRWGAGVVTVALAAVVVIGLITAPSAEANRAEAIGSRIKCPVCQGEAIADSPAELSESMMALVEERIAQGWSDEQIIDAFVASYGEWILLDPPIAPATALLWLIPAAGVAVGVMAALRRHRATLPVENETADAADNATSHQAVS